MRARVHKIIARVCEIEMIKSSLVSRGTAKAYINITSMIIHPEVVYTNISRMTNEFLVFVEFWKIEAEIEKKQERVYIHMCTRYLFHITYIQERARDIYYSRFGKGSGERERPWRAKSTRLIALCELLAFRMFNPWGYNRYSARSLLRFYSRSYIFIYIHTSERRAIVTFIIRFFF